MRILLFDGSAILYRSFFAFIRNPLRNRKGFNTSGIFGFLNTIKRVRDKFGLDYGCVVFDLPSPTFRHEEYREYKGQRPEAPNELKLQIPVMKEILINFGIPILEKEGFEADDIIGTLAERFKKEDVIIVSPDKDVLQLVGGKIKVYDPYRDILYDEEKVFERYGIPVNRLLDYFALVGDRTDNIPGVPGIGKKRAKSIITRYSSMEEAFEKEAALSKHKEDFLLSKRLIEIKRDVDLNINPEDLKIKEMNKESLLKIFRELDFSSFVKDFLKNVEGENNTYIEVIKKEHFEKGEFAFHITENTLFFTDDLKKVYITEKDPYRFFDSEEIVKIGFDIKNIMHRYREMKPPYIDLMIGMWLLNPDRKRFTLEDLFMSIGHAEVGIKDNMVAVYIKEAYEKLRKEIEELSLEKVFYDIENPLIGVLYRMEKRGIGIDGARLLSLKKEFLQYIEDLKQEIYKYSGVIFNINSPKQLQEVLFHRLKLPPVKKTKTGYSTDISVLMKLVDEHPVVEKLITYREFNKLLTGFVEPLIKYNSTGRIYTTFEQTGTSTGRLSSRSPNLQNIPIKGEWGRKIRDTFIAKNGYKLISADYSQIELRIMAHLSGDQTLIDAFNRGVDVHSTVMARLLGVPLSEVTEEQRRLGKVINYGLIYGMSDFGLSKSLGIDVGEARKFIESYFNAFPGVAQWRSNLLKEVEQRGYTRTIMGRIRWIGNTRGDERIALNAPVQGSAADIIKMAMIRIDRKFKDDKIEGGMVLQIHDELLFEVKNEMVEYAVSMIKEEMEKIMKLSVPLVVDIKAGDRWGEIH